MTGFSKESVDKAFASGDIRTIKKLLRNNPNDPGLLHKYGMLLSSKDDYNDVKKAISVFEKCQDITTIDSFKDKMQFNIASCNYALGNIIDAKNIFEELLHVYDHKYILLRLINCYVASSDLSSAKVCLDELLKYSDSLDLRAKQASFALKEDDTEKFCFYMDKLLKDDFKTMMTHFNVLVYYYMIYSKNLIMDYSDYSYTAKQIENYQISLLLKKLESHLTQTSNDKSKFYNGINLKQLLEDIKLKLNEDTFFNFFSNDVYVIPYSYIGTRGEGYLKVITELNGKNILSMYPTMLYDNPKIFNPKQNMRVK